MRIDVHQLDTVDSTNTWARLHAREFDPHALTLVRAAEQTSGRGRFSRKWHSPKDKNLYVTFCFFTPALRPDTPNISQVLILSVVDFLDSLGVKAAIKWPNDVVVGDKKIAGILAEAMPINDQYFIIAGLGLNINMEHDELINIDRPATSLFLETGRTLEPHCVLMEIAEQFREDLQVYLSHGFMPFMKQFADNLCLKRGARLKLKDFKQVWEGVFHSLNTDGSINMELPLKEIRTFLDGEIMER